MTEQTAGYTRADLIAAATEAIEGEHWCGSPALLKLGGNDEQRALYPDWIPLVARMFAEEAVDAVLRVQSDRLGDVS